MEYYSATKKINELLKFLKKLKQLKLPYDPAILLWVHVQKK